MNNTFAATRIQSLYRGYHTRKQIKYELQKQQKFEKEYIDNIQSEIIKKSTKIIKVNDFYKFEKEI